MGLLMLPVLAMAPQDVLEQERVRTLLHDLGVDDPQRREAATRELMLLGRQAQSAVEEALRRAKDPEARRILEDLCRFLGATDRVTPQLLAEKRIDLSISDGPPSAVFREIMASSKIPIEVLIHDEGARKLTPTRFEAATLEEIFKSIASQLAVQWRIVNERKVVFFHPPGADAMGLILKLYDVRPLTFRILDMPGRIDWGDTGVTFVDQPAEAQPLLGGEDLVELIRHSVSKETWDEEGHSLNFMNGLLIAKTTAAMHEQVEQYLRKVRRDFSLQIRHELWMIAHAPRLLSDVLDRSPRHLTEAQFDELLKSPSASLVGQVEFRSFQCQRVSGQSGSEKSIVVSYDGPSPRRDILFDGLFYDVKTVLSNDRKSASLDFLGSLSRILSIEKVKTEQGEIQVPKRSRVPLMISPRVECGRLAVLLQTGPVEGYGEKRTQMLFVLRVSPVPAR
jgi:hypothetical protein